MLTRDNNSIQVISFHINKRFQLTFCPQSSCKVETWHQSSNQKLSFLSASFVRICSRSKSESLHQFCQITNISFLISSHGVFVKKEKKLMTENVYPSQGRYMCAPVACPQDWACSLSLPLGFPLPSLSNPRHLIQRIGYYCLSPAAYSRQTRCHLIIRQGSSLRRYHLRVWGRLILAHEGGWKASQLTATVWINH